MLGCFEELENISRETVRKFYVNELNLSYNRCCKPVDPVELNLGALAAFVKFIKAKIDEGYELFSIDEAGFGN